jgi:hypothetical protein
MKIRPGRRLLRKRWLRVEVEEKKESEHRCPNRIVKNVHGQQKAGALSSCN